METKVYHTVDSGDWDDDYDGLVGPDGFKCILTEPEDRVWYRDLQLVVDKLNEQHAEIHRLRDEIECLLNELYDYST